ncbi:hypothetical protein B0H16DRAFT_1705517 [Mycena metata]|uniref:Uncharacterized protein n=1 Tax=Mycena metata TaxID=1033252 RepID=A0AAD7DVY0_9AGAR|nr:hypothetical protein B0H16DRAFT_1705517 [Mycena metata]
MLPMRFKEDRFCTLTPSILWHILTAESTPNFGRLVNRSCPDLNDLTVPNLSPTAYKVSAVYSLRNEPTIPQKMAAPACAILGAFTLVDFQGHVLNVANAVNPVISQTRNPTATTNQQWPVGIGDRKQRPRRPRIQPIGTTGRSRSGLGHDRQPTQSHIHAGLGRAHHQHCVRTRANTVNPVISQTRNPTATTIQQFHGWGDGACADLGDGEQEHDLSTDSMIQAFSDTSDLPKHSLTSIFLNLPTDF